MTYYFAQDVETKSLPLFAVYTQNIRETEIFMLVSQYRGCTQGKYLTLFLNILHVFEKKHTHIHTKNSAYIGLVYNSVMPLVEAVLAQIYRKSGNSPILKVNTNKFTCLNN